MLINTEVCQTLSKGGHANTHQFTSFLSSPLTSSLAALEAKHTSRHILP